MKLAAVFAGLAILAAASAEADGLADEPAPLAFDVPGRVFRATPDLAAGQPLGIEGTTSPLPGARVDVVLWTDVVATLTTTTNGAFVVPKGTVATHVEVVVPGLETGFAYLHDSTEWIDTPYRQEVRRRVDASTVLLFLLRRTATYSGRVVGPDGKGVADAAVEVARDFGMSGGDPLQSARTGARTRTGKDGAFRVAFAPGKIRVVATLPGSGTLGESVVRENVPAGADVKDLLLTIRPPLGLDVRVTRLGEPVPGATITRCVAKNGMSGTGAETGADGTGRFQWLERDEPVILVAWHPIGGVAATRLERKPATPVELALLPGKTVQGWVTDVAGKPIANAEIQVFLLGQPAIRGLPADFDADALSCAGLSMMSPHLKTDAKGYFRGSHFVHEPGTVTVSANGWSRERVRVGARSADPLRVVLRKRVTVSGRIRRPDGIAMPGRGGEVTVHQPGVTFSAITKDDRFTLEVDPGVWEVHYIEVNGEKSEKQSVTIDPGHPVELVIDAPP